MNQKTCEMNVRNERLSIEEARQIDMVEYLSKEGHEPTKIRNADYWYFSPLRTERTPSFKVNRKLNRWYDHGMGKGGNIIDFAILYHNCTVGEFLQKLNGSFSFHQRLSGCSFPSNIDSAESKIKIVKERPLLSFFLCRYLHQRRIPLDVAERFCKEVKYEINGKEYFAIGFKNNSGGYEIRNPYFKAASAPKDITTFNNQGKEIFVFEGFTDFLSFMAIDPNQQHKYKDFLVLNSVSFFEKARPFMERHDAIRLYLDRDTTGQNYSRYALSLSTKYKDESNLYKHYKDLNDWILNIGKTEKKNLRQKLQ